MRYTAKRIISAVMSAVIIFTTTACGTISLQETDETSEIPIVNAETISGITEEKQNVNPPLEIPNITTVNTTKNPLATTLSQSNTLDTTTTSQISLETTITAETTYTALTTTKAPVSATVSQNTTSSATNFSTSKPVSDANLSKNTYSPLNYSETKGVWISYIELYPVLFGKSQAEFKAGIGKLYDNCLSLGFNTVYVHVRPFGDAMYNSSYYCWSKYCTGTIGVTPSYDPLKIMIDEAHKRNISFQAWINPLRCHADGDIASIPNTYQTKKWYNNNSGDYIVKVDNYWYLNPAYSEVIKLVANGAAEIVANYNVDGLHMDDYFYPTTDTYFDSTAYNASGYSDLAEFRLANNDKLVSAIYSAVHKYSSAIYGVSTQGNIANNMAYMYANVEKWCTNSGYVDYMAPQIYYGFENAAQPYQKVLEQWENMLKGTGRKLIPGLCLYKCGTYDQWGGAGAYEWQNSSTIVKRQILAAREVSTYGGIIIYSYKYLFDPPENVSAIQKEIDNFVPLLK